MGWNRVSRVDRSSIRFVRVPTNVYLVWQLLCFPLTELIARLHVCIIGIRFENGLNWVKQGWHNHHTSLLLVHGMNWTELWNSVSTQRSLAMQTSYQGMKWAPKASARPISLQSCNAPIFSCFTTLTYIAASSSHHAGAWSNGLPAWVP